MAKILNPGPSQTVVEYVYDGNQLIEERDGSNNVIASYVYGPGIDEPIALTRGSDTYYYHQDDLGNVVALTDGNDGATEGDVVERYNYGPFGAPTIYEADGTTPRTASIAENPYLFTGREWNPELNAYWYRTRYYDPTAGRFLSRDTIGLWGDPANLGNPYTYVNNNPWSKVDPYGKDASDWLFGIDPNDVSGINQEKYKEYLERKQNRAMAASEIAARNEAAVFGGDIFDALEPDGALPDYANAYGTFIYAKDKGLEVGGQSIAVGTIMIPAGSVGVLVDAGYILVDSADGSLDPLATGMAVVGIGGFGAGKRALQREQEIQAAAQALMHSKAVTSAQFVAQMAAHRGFAFDSFGKFKSYWGNAPKGYAWHHIVEHSKEVTFGPKAVHNAHNLVLVPQLINQSIADYYSTIRPFTGGKSVRKWLDSQSYDLQRTFGLDILQRVTTGLALP